MIWCLCSNSCKACVWIQEDIFKSKILPQEMRNPNKTLQELEHKHQIIKHYDRYYFYNRTFGGITSKYCCILLPDVPSLIMKTTDFSKGTMSLQSINAYIANDYDIVNYKHLNALKDVVSLSITRAAMQSYAITLSNSFKNKMSMVARSSLYATPVPGQKTLLLSKKNLASNSIKLNFESEGKEVVTKGTEVINLLSMLEFNLPQSYKLVSTAIEIEEPNGILIAIISFDKDVVSISPVDSPPVDYIVSSVKERGNYRNRNLLMSDDEEEI